MSKDRDSRPAGRQFLWALSHNSRVMVSESSRGGSDYRCVATSIEGFVQQLAVSYLRHGYWLYVTGRIPAGKDPRAVDRKLLKQYQIGISKWARVRRKRAGHANLHYLRCERFFVLCATHGQHRFFEEEISLIRDCRKVPIKFAGYSISYRGGHPHVRIEREQYNLLKAHLLELATRRKRETLERALFDLPFEPYAPVRRQLLNIVRALNAARRQAGYEPLSPDCLRFKRRIVRPFEEVDQESEAYPQFSHPAYRNTVPGNGNQHPAIAVRHDSPRKPTTIRTD